MTLRIRQIVLAARDLRATVAQLESVLGLSVCYRDPEVAKFGLENALFAIGHEGFVQFLEVVSPIQDNTAAGRHLDRHGDSGYMLILQTDDLARDRARVEKMGVRIVWQATHPDVSAIHLHPKDIGAAIVSIDQPLPPESWRWAGPDWRKYLSKSGPQRVTSTTVAATNVAAMATRWSTVLNTSNPVVDADEQRIDIQDAALRFIAAPTDVIAAFGLSMSDPQAALAHARKLGMPVQNNNVTICGARFELLDLSDSSL
jgi:hypothetical protein